MTVVARLVTLVDVDNGDAARSVSLSARQEAVLVDGRRFVLLGDRGWSGSLNRVRREEAPDDDSLARTSRTSGL